MLSLMVFIIGHCRYSSFLTIWLLGVAFGVSGEVLLGVPGHMMGGLHNLLSTDRKSVV